MQTIVRDFGGLVCPVFANTIFATSDKVRVSDKFVALLTLDGDRNFERVVIRLISVQSFDLLAPSTHQGRGCKDP